MLTIEMDATIQADPTAVWQAWMPRFQKRPPEEEARNLNLYYLAYGLKVPHHLGRCQRDARLDRRARIASWQAGY